METAISVPLFCTVLLMKVTFNLLLIEKEWESVYAFIYMCTTTVLKENFLLESAFIVCPSASNQTLVLAQFVLLFLHQCSQHLVCATSRGQQDHT